MIDDLLLLVSELVAVTRTYLILEGKPGREASVKQLKERIEFLIKEIGYHGIHGDF